MNVASRTALLLVALSIAGAASSPGVRAQPGGAKSASTAKDRAAAFIELGNKRVLAGDYAGGIALFNDAYNEFPDPVIILNIGIAQEGAKLYLDAVKSYQLYIDSPEADPKLIPKVKERLAAVETKLGQLEIVVIGPPGLEIQIDDGEWASPPTAPIRVMPGSYVVRARAPVQPTPVESTVTAKAGKVIPVRLTVQPPPPPPPPPPPEPPPPPAITPPHGGEDATGRTTVATVPPTTTAELGAGTSATETAKPALGTVTALATVTARPSRFSFFAGAIGAVSDAGVRGLVGVGYEPHARVRIGLDLILGAGLGVAPRGTFYLTSGRLRPTVNLAVPIRRLEELDAGSSMVAGPCGPLIDGTRSPSIEVAGHVGVGLEWRASRRVALVGELGFEHYPWIDTCLADASVITPVLGLVGRL